MRAMASRDYRVFLAGGLISSIGSNMQIAALAWVVQAQTHSAVRTTGIAFIGIIPLLLLGPTAGVLADRLPRRKFLVGTNVLNGLQAAALWLVWIAGSGTNYWLLFCLSLLGGMFTAIQTPAWQSMPAELVAREHLINAITLNSTQFNIARALGPLCAGLAIDTFGAGSAFGINALSYVAIIVALLMLGPAPQVHAPNDGLTNFQRWRLGLGHIMESPVLRLVISVHMVFAFVIPPVTYLIAKLSQDDLKIKASSYGVLLGVFGIGAIMAAVSLGNSEDHVRKSRALALGIFCGAVSMLGLAIAPNYAAAIATMVLLGAAYLIVVSVDHGAIQTFTTDAFRGRVTSVWLMTFGLCMPLGVLGQGKLADTIGVRRVFGIDAAILATMLCILIARRLLTRLDAPPELQLPES